MAALRPLALISAATALSAASSRPVISEIAALVGQRQGDALPDAAARPGHQRDLATQPQFHSPALRSAFVAGIIAE